MRTLVAVAILLASSLLAPAQVGLPWPGPGAFAAPLSPQLRATNSVVGTGSSLTINLPTGSQTGDFAVVLVGHGFSVNTITGYGTCCWTLMYQDVGAQYVNGGGWYKTLTSADVSNGSITFNFSGSYEGVVAMATFVGATGGARGWLELQSGTGSFTSPVTGPSVSAVTNDSGLYFTMNRGASTDTVNRGTLKETQNNGANASGVLYFETISSTGTVTPTFSYTGTLGPGYVVWNVIVKP